MVRPTYGTRGSTSTTAQLTGKQLVRRAAAFHLGTRALTLAAVGAAAHRKGISFGALFSTWDGRWYRIIAEHWYPDSLPSVGHRVVTNPAGFFPLLPSLVAPVRALGVPYAAVVGVETLLWSTIAAVLIALVTRHYTDSRVALLTSCCWSVFPTAAVLSFGYAEGLFTMLAAGCLLMLQRRRWLAAAILCALAGLARPTGLVVVAVLAVAVLIAVRDHRARPRDLLVLPLAAAGVLGSLGLIAVATGRWNGWLLTERQGWGVRFDAGATFVRWAVRVIAHPHDLIHVFFVLGVLGAVLLVVIAALERPPLPVQLYLMAGTVLALGQGGQFFLSPLRFLLPVFPLLVPAARFLARRRAGVSGALLTIAALLSAAIGVYYFTVSGGAP